MNLFVLLTTKMGIDISLVKVETVFINFKPGIFLRKPLSISVISYICSEGMSGLFLTLP